MEEIEKNKFLTLINDIADKEEAVYYDTVEKNLYLYHQKIKLVISSVGEQIHFSFITEKTRDSLSSTTVSFPIDEVKDILEKFIDSNSKYIINSNLSVPWESVEEDITYLEEQLKNNYFTKDWNKASSSYQICFKNQNNNNNYYYKLGVVDRNFDKLHNSLFILKVPFLIEDQNGKITYIQHLMPAFKFKDFKSFKNLFNINEGAHKFNDFINLVDTHNKQFSTYLKAFDLEQSLTNSNKPTNKPLKL